MQKWLKEWEISQRLYAELEISRKYSESSIVKVFEIWQMETTYAVNPAATLQLKNDSILLFLGCFVEVDKQVDPCSAPLSQKKSALREVTK